MDQDDKYESKMSPLGRKKINKARICSWSKRILAAKARKTGNAPVKASVLIPDALFNNNLPTHNAPVCRATLVAFADTGHWQSCALTQYLAEQESLKRTFKKIIGMEAYNRWTPDRAESEIMATAALC